jgi:hypothetical protein
MNLSLWQPMWLNLLALPLSYKQPPNPVSEDFRASQASHLAWHVHTT